jgi:hypothetical protein
MVSETTHRTTVADVEEPTPLDREQAISLIVRAHKATRRARERSGLHDPLLPVAGRRRAGRKGTSGTAWQRWGDFAAH